MNYETTLNELEAYIRLLRRVLKKASILHIDKGYTWKTLGMYSCANPRIFQRIAEGHMPSKECLLAMDNYFKTGEKHGKRAGTSED